MMEREKRREWSRGEGRRVEKRNGMERNRTDRIHGWREE